MNGRLIVRGGREGGLMPAFGTHRRRREGEREKKVHVCLYRVQRSKRKKKSKSDNSNSSNNKRLYQEEGGKKEGGREGVSSLTHKHQNSKNEINQDRRGTSKAKTNMI